MVFNVFLVLFNGKEIVGTFYRKELRKTNHKNFRIVKVIKKRGKAMTIRFIVQLIRTFW